MEIKIHCAYDDMVELHRLIPNPRNPNQHPEQQIKLLAEIIKFQGWRVPITVSTRSGYIVRGHGRYEAAKLLGIEKVPVDYQDYENEAEEWADLIADNRIAELAEMSDEKLKDLLKELDKQEFDISLTGYTLEDFEKLIAPDFWEEKPAEDFDVEDAAIKITNPITKPGDLIIMGDHRLLCGDSRNYNDVMKLMGNEKAQMVFTSPPYASQREYDPESGFKPIKEEEYTEWFSEIAKNIWVILKDTGSFFLNIKENARDGERSLYVMKLIIYLKEQLGWKYIDQLIWNKPGLPGGWSNRFRNDFEPIFFFAKNDDGIDCIVEVVDEIPDGIDTYFFDAYEDIFHLAKQTKIKFKPKSVMKETDTTREWNRPNKKNRTIGRSGNISLDQSLPKTRGLARPGNVIKLGNNNEFVKHPAAYSVKLVEFFIKAFTDKGDIIFEPFAGSGTNFIAAENQGRRCYGIEISPKYCDGFNPS